MTDLSAIIPSQSARRGLRLTPFGVGLALLVLIAAIPRLLSYDYSLPYVDFANEPNKYLGAQEWRGLYDSGGYYEGYPPGYVVVDLMAQVALESVGLRGLAVTVQALRLVSVIVDLAALVFVALTARLVANSWPHPPSPSRLYGEGEKNNALGQNADSPIASLAGLIAGAAWGLSPLVIENNVQALPDPMIACLAIVALWLAANALVNPARRHWAIWSVVAGLLATLLKYSAFPLIGPGGLAAIFLTIRDRRNVRLIVIQGLIVAVTLFWLFFIYGIDVSSVEREGATIRESGLSNILIADRVLANLYGVIVPIPPVVFAATVLAGIAGYLVAARLAVKRVRVDVLALCLLVIVGVAWLISAYTVVAPDYRMRDVLPGTTAACVVFGAAVAQILYLVPPRLARVGMVAAAAGAAVFILLPDVQQTRELVIKRESPDRRVALREWADVNLDPGTVLVSEENDKTFNPLWGGLIGRKWFDWWPSEDFTEFTPQEWRSVHGISYVVFTHDMLDDIRDAHPHYTDSMLHLRDFDADPGRGPRMSVYRTWRPEHETDVRFGDAIRLVGYDGTLQAASGEAMTLRFYWEARHTPATNYSLFIHLTRADAVEPLAQADGAPASPERPTLTWDDSGETIIGQPFTLTVPADLEAGDYTLRIGLYDFVSGERLPVRGNGASGDAWDVPITVGT